jgi:hypothetical protein
MSASPLSIVGSETFIALVLVGGTASTGCATTQEYVGFAKAGSSYAAAVDRLLVVSRDTTIDATSNKLLQNDVLANLTLEHTGNSPRQI